MNKTMQTAVFAAAMGSALPALAQSFQDCTDDCRTAYERAVGQCAGGRTPEIVRACHARANQTRARCMDRCTARENQRLRLEQARQREAQERRLRGQPGPRR